MKSKLNSKSHIFLTKIKELKITLQLSQLDQNILKIGRSLLIPHGKPIVKKTI